MQSIRIKMYYYTYAYLREDRTPYYIGKGKGNRIYDKRKTTKPPKDKSRIIFLKQNLTEQEAFKHEIYMIFLYGRKDLGTGILHNRTDGGEGSSGAIISEETRIKMSEAQKDKIFSEEHRRKMSEAQKGKTRSEETRIKMSERIRSEESRKKMSESGKVKIFSEEHRKNISKSHKGKKWWNDGYGNIKYMAECPGDSWRLGRKK